MDGILLIDKQAGLTSHQAVAKVRRVLRCPHAGHAGSLDPMATGLLLVALGEATKLVEILMDAGKVYEAEVRLGTATRTDDAESEGIFSSPVPNLSEAQVQGALEAFRGEFQQVPPIYSALKVDGVRAYRRARDGEEFDLKARAVQVYSLDLVRLEGERVWLRVHCGRGTYIRSLARDLGVALGTVAHLGALRRTSVGPYRVEDAVVLGEDQVLTRDSLRARMLPLRQSFGSAPAVRITEDYLGALRYGRSPLPSQLLDPPPSKPGTRFLLVDQSMEPLAVAEPDPVTGGGRLRRVLQRASTRLHTS